MNRLNIRFGLIPNPTTAIRPRDQDWWRQIHDPSSERVIRWNRMFFVTALISLFVDPLFFILLGFRHDRYCLKMDYGWAGSLVAIRTICDMFSAFNIMMKFRTAYVARDTRVFGRGDLVTDPSLITRYYLNKDFIIDLTATLPLPQCVIWGFMPSVMSRTTTNLNHTITFLIILQYIPKLMVVFPLNARIIKNTGVGQQYNWTGAAYNLVLFLLAGHVLGSVWYLLAVERIFICWKTYCRQEKGRYVCSMTYLDCSSHSRRYKRWYNHTKVFKKCNPEHTDFSFGLFGDALTDDVPSASFFQKYFYNLWFGLRSLCSYGQSLEATPFLVETIFSIVICLMGLVFFALLIGNIQTFLESNSARLDEWRNQRKDTEEWMRHRQLPPELQDRVRRFVRYNWMSTRGVKEDEILQSLPLDLKRQIQKHLCLDLVRRVPFFSKMDDQLLDAICGRLGSSLHTKGTYIVHEGDPVNEMLFIIRGQLESSTTDGGRSGFFNSITLKPGDFCGEELLTWALMTASNLNLPDSTRTVKCITEVEGFALCAEDLKFFATQFRRLHSKKLQHVFRYYSHQWRTWGARILQAAWRRHQKRKLAEELARHENPYDMQPSDSDDDDDDDDYDYNSTSRHSTEHAIKATMLASRFAANTRRASSHKVRIAEPTMPKLIKPGDPNF